MRAEPKPRRSPDRIIAGCTGRRSRKRMSVSGSSGRKGSSSLRNTKATHPAVLEEEYLRREFEFDDTLAIAKQKAALHRINMSFLRESWLYANPGMPSELIGEFLSLGKSQAASVAKAVREMDGTPLAKLVVTVLGGMLNGELAGVRGTPLTSENRLLFRHVATFSPSAHVGLLPSSLRVHRCGGDALRMLLSAFRCEYQNWVGGSTCE